MQRYFLSGEISPFTLVKAGKPGARLNRPTSQIMNQIIQFYFHNYYL